MIRAVQRFAVWIAFGIACIVLGWWLRAQQAPEWLQPDTTQHPPALRPWMVEADCYSQMARVQRILHGEGLIQNHFAMENWPEGLVPSTTAPFDYVILLLYAPLKLFTAHPLDWAGALVSPVLWVAMVLFWLLFRSREFSTAGRAVLIVGSMALPTFLWATACGRPRHQSLILLLMALALTAEYERWNMTATPRKAWSVFAGVAWGLACWTSLFEPVITFGILVIYNLSVRRRESAPLLITFGLVMLLALLVEGVHVFIPPAEYRGALVNWLGTIAEMRGTNFNPAAWAPNAGRALSLLLVPVVAWMLWHREFVNRTDRFLIILTFVLALIATMQMRWAYYAGLGELFLVARFYQLAPWRWPNLAVLAVFLLGLLNADYLSVAQARQMAPNQPSQQLVEISRSIDEPGGILAPWWLSPGLLYFSEHPIVSGSSHCGISGIVASAEFYTATSWTVAEKILRERKVRWVVVSDDPRYVFPLLNTSLGILGQRFVTDDDPRYKIDQMAGQILINDRYVPTWLPLRGVTQNLKLYEYVPVEK